MAKFRKKPIVIEAEQYLQFGKLVKGMCNSRSCYSSGNINPHVHTIHDGQIVDLQIGDWVIPEPDGEHYYPCKPDIFEKTYEPVEGGPLLSMNHRDIDSIRHRFVVTYWPRGVNEVFIKDRHTGKVARWSAPFHPQQLASGMEQFIRESLESDKLDAVALFISENVRA